MLRAFAPLRFQPFDATTSIPNIIVDGRANDATLLTLSHWPKTNTPAGFKADTSTESVLRFLRSADRDRTLARVQAVSNNHLDADGLVGIWALLNMRKGLAQAEMLTAIAQAGDFTLFTDPLAVKVSLVLQNHRQRSYEALLPRLPDMVDNIWSYADEWQEDYAEILRSQTRVARQKVRITDVPELDLRIVESDSAIHPMAVYVPGRLYRVLFITNGVFDFVYRYETWVQLASHHPAPRIDLRLLTYVLQQMEPRPGRWTFDGLAQIVPHLSFTNSAGRPIRSGISPPMFISILTQYLQRQAKDRELLWEPYDAPVVPAATASVHP